jgi:hypothetical protein
MGLDVSKVTALDDFDGITAFFGGCLVSRGDIGQDTKLQE